MLDRRICFSLRHVSHDFDSQCYPGDLTIWLKAYCEPWKDFKKVALTYRREFQGKCSAELAVICVRQDLLRARKAVFQQTAFVVPTWHLYVGIWTYRSAHTGYFSHWCEDWIASLRKFKVLHLANNSNKNRELTLTQVGKQSTFPGAPGLYGPALKFRFLPGTVTCFR